MTEAFRQNLIARGIPSEKVVTIPNGADTEYWKPDDSFPGNDRDSEFQDKFIVLYVGAHGISHALNCILDVANRVQGHLGYSIPICRRRCRKTEASERGLYHGAEKCQL